MNELFLSIDPKIRMAIIGGLGGLAVDWLMWRKSVRAATAKELEPPVFAWELRVASIVIGILAGFGYASQAEVVTPPETPPVVMDALKSLLALRGAM